MRFIFPPILALSITACVHEAPVSRSPLERLLESSRSDLCEGVLAEALAEVRRPGHEWQPDELRRMLRWAFSHNHDDCGESVSGRALWLDLIAALGRQSGDDAGLALVASLRSSHNVSSRAVLREETEAALSALGQGGPYGADVVEALLAWYVANGEGCTVEAYRGPVVAVVVAAGEPGALSLAQHFPPDPTLGQCAPGWMLSEVLAGAPESAQDRVISEVATAENLGEELPRLIELVDGTEGRLQRALEGRVCFIATSLAQQALTGSGDDPRDAVADAFGACASTDGGSARVLVLQRRLTSWLIARGHGEEAWSSVLSMPAEDVTNDWLTEVGTAVVEDRLIRSEPLRAAEMLTELAGRVGEDRSELDPLRRAVVEALLDVARQRIEGRDVAGARAALAPAEGLAGASNETRRLGAVLVLMEASAVIDGGTCLSAEEMQRVGEGLRGAADAPPEAQPAREEIQEQIVQASRSWRRVTRRCRRARR